MESVSFEMETKETEHKHRQILWNIYFANKLDTYADSSTNSQFDKLSSNNIDLMVVIQDNLRSCRPGIKYHLRKNVCKFEVATSLIFSSKWLRLCQAVTLKEF